MALGEVTIAAMLGCACGAVSCKLAHAVDLGKAGHFSLTTLMETPPLENVSGTILKQWCLPFALQHTGTFASVVWRSDAVKEGSTKSRSNVMERNRRTPS